MSDALSKRAWIERVLGYKFALAPETKGSQPLAATAGLVAYAKSRLVWLAARQKMRSEIEKLRGALTTAFAGFDVDAELNSAYTDFVDPVLTELDESLADKLDQASNATDPATRSKLVEEAKSIMQRYQDYIAAAPVIAALDSNPAVPLAIRSTLSGTLTALAKAVH
jgi:hypothetical protein